MVLLLLAGGLFSGLWVGTDIRIDTSLNLIFSLLLVCSSFLLWQVNREIWKWSKERAEAEDTPQLLPVGKATIKVQEKRVTVVVSIVNPGRFVALLKEIEFDEFPALGLKQQSDSWVSQQPVTDYKLRGKLPGVVFPSGVTEATLHFDIPDEPLKPFPAEALKTIQETVRNTKKLSIRFRYQMGDYRETTSPLLTLDVM